MPTTGNAAPLVLATGAAATAADVEAFTLTCLNHQPLPGVWTYTEMVCGPTPSALAGTIPLNPEAAANGLPSAAATSGRLWANVSLVRSRPPPSIVSSQASTSSAPAQPWAVLSKNQPATLKEPVGTVAFEAGASMNPSYVLSRMPPGPGVQSVVASANVG